LLVLLWLWPGVILALDNTAILQNLYFALDGDYWYWTSATGLRWTFGNSDPCIDDWHGVVCVANEITELTLVDLTGNLTSEFSDFTHLEVLNIGGNNLFGNLPLHNLRQNTNLSVLSVEANYLTGPISQSYLNDFDRLTLLYLSSNSFSGPIVFPYNCKDLATYNIEYNYFFGRMVGSGGEIRVVSSVTPPVLRIALEGSDSAKRANVH